MQHRLITATLFMTGLRIAPDAIWNGLFTFLKPELFRGTAAGTR